MGATSQRCWQFGVLAPRRWSEAGGQGQGQGVDPWWQETHCLIEPAAGGGRITGKLRFLQVRRREPGTEPGQRPGDERETQEIDFSFGFGGGARAVAIAELQVPGAVDRNGGVVHRRWPLSGLLRLDAEPMAADQPLLRLRVRVENLAGWVPAGAPRDQALRASLLATQVLVQVTGGAILSPVQAPGDARSGGPAATSGTPASVPAPRSSDRW